MGCACSVSNMHKWPVGLVSSGEACEIVGFAVVFLLIYTFHSRSCCAVVASLLLAVSIWFLSYFQVYGVYLFRSGTVESLTGCIV